MKKETIIPLTFLFGLSCLWIFFNRDHHGLLFYIVDIPVFILLYGSVFFIGIPSVSQALRYGTKNTLIRTLIFPIVLITIYYCYILLYGQPVIKGVAMLLPYFIFFPVLALYHRPLEYNLISWWDIMVLLLFLWPITMLDLSANSDLPLEGIHFDSVFRIMIILTTVYAFVVVRRLSGVGFWIDFSWRKLGITIGVWALYISLVITAGMIMNFIEYEGMLNNQWGNREEIAIRFCSIYLHTALFEELFFRGLLQNLLANKISQSAYPFRFWGIGIILLSILALFTGILLEDGLSWFPLAITLILFAVAFLLSNVFRLHQHGYLAMAITSVLFGLAHFHSGSVIYVGFAIIAGWAYGYVHWKTRNVFYAALIHTLVNISPLIMGLELMN